MDSALSNYPYLTYDEFTASIAAFCRQYPDWAIVQSQGQQYLYHEQTTASSALLTQHPDELSDIEDDDPAWDASMNEPPNTACRAEYHAVFSRTWQVPVLYLRVFDGDEHVMDVEKAKRLLVRDAGLRASMDAVGFGGALGIQDHPLLNVPFLYLHPCHTATLLRSVAAAEHGIVVGTSAYMAAWLSLTGQAAGVVLHTPPAE